MSGGTLHDGLEYQAAVTVLAALELVAIKGYVAELVIEPVSDEDLEADLSRSLENDETPPLEGGAETRAPNDAYRLVVQSKRRDGGGWTSAKVNGVLDHGKRRTPARARLHADPTVRYLLVTSGLLMTPARSLRVETFGEWPDPEPADSPFAEFNSGPVCRFAVMDALTEPLIRVRIEESLRDALAVPFTKVSDCIDSLMDAVRRRSRSTHYGVWTKAEIFEILTRHDAILPGELEMAAYVEPLNYRAIEDRLMAQQAVLLVGPSGTGKTCTAERLVKRLRQRLSNGARNPVLSNTDAPQQFANEVRTRPAVIYLDDPWGPVSLAAGAQGWTKVLRDEIEHRHRDAWIVITSRSDVFEGAHTRDAFEPWTVVLDASAYGPAQRLDLLRAALASLSYTRQSRFEPYVGHAVASLETPLEIRVLVTSLGRDTTVEEHDAEWAHGAIAKAKSRRYQDVVAEQVQDRKDEAAATALWLLFLAQNSLSREDLVRVRRLMAARGSAPRLEALVDFLRAGQSLDHVDSRFGCAHPQVAAGLLLAARTDPAVFEEAGLHLLEALAADPTGSGPLHAARILAALLAEKATIATEWLPLLSPDARTAVDRALHDALATFTGTPFAEAFKLAAALGSPHMFAFDFARWATAAKPLPNNPDLHDMMPAWNETPADPNWAAAITGDPAACSVVERFVEDVVPMRDTFYPRAFPRRLDSLGLDLTEAFGRAVLSHVGYGYYGAIEMLIEGTQPRLRALEPAVDAAQNMFAEYTPELRDGWKLQLVNGVFDDEYSQHLAEPDEDLYCACVVIRTFVAELRSREGWKALAAYPRASAFVWDWVRVLDAESSVDLEEMEALIDLTEGDHRRAAVWTLVAERPDAGLADIVRRRAGVETGPLARAAFYRARVVHDLDDLKIEQEQRLRTGGLASVLVLHQDLVWRAYSSPPEPFLSGRDALLARLAPPEAELAVAAVAAEPPPYPSLGPEATALAKGLVTDDPRLAGRLLALTGGRSLAVDRLYVSAMDNWTPEETATPQAALEAVIAAGREDLVREALVHPLGSVAARAIASLGPSLSPAETMALPGLEGHQVRKAVLDVLAATPGDEAALALLEFCDPDYRSLHENARHAPLARSAAKILAARETWSDAFAATVTARVTELRNGKVRVRLFRRLGAVSAGIRSWLLDLALDTSDLRHRPFAADGLLANARLVERAVLDRISEDAIVTAPVETAARLIRLVGLKGEDAQVERLLVRLSGLPDRALLALLLVGPGKPGRSDRIAGLFEPNPAARRLSDPEAGRIAFDGLDAMAAPTIVRQLQTLLPERFEPTPRQTWAGAAFPRGSPESGPASIP